MKINKLLLFLKITHVVWLLFLRKHYSNKRIIDRASLIRISLYQKRDYISISIKLPELLSGKYAKGI